MVDIRKVMLWIMPVIVGAIGVKVTSLIEYILWVVCLIVCATIHGVIIKLMVNDHEIN